MRAAGGGKGGGVGGFRRERRNILGPYGFRRFRLDE
jgi:hypothetical protein